MSLGYMAPEWFKGYDIVLEFLFAVVSIGVSALAMKAHRITYHKNLKLFGAGFILIGVSYVVQSVSNYLLLSGIKEKLAETAGMYLHMLLMTAGLSFLAYSTFKTDKQRILWLMTGISIAAIVFSGDASYTFFLISTMYLAALSWHFVTNYAKRKEKKSLLVAAAFLFLLFGDAHFLVAMDHSTFYAIGHILELAAYLLLLLNFYMVLRHE